MSNRTTAPTGTPCNCTLCGRDITHGFRYLIPIVTRASNAKAWLDQYSNCCVRCEAKYTTEEALFWLRHGRPATEAEWDRFEHDGNWDFMGGVRA